MPDLRYNDPIFTLSNPMWLTNDSSWKARIIAKQIADRKLHFNRIIDYGCGNGQLLSCLSDIYPDIELIGYDPSLQLSMFWTEIQLTRPNISFINELDSVRTYSDDLVLFVDVIEHISDPVQELIPFLTTGCTCIFHIPLEISLSTLFRQHLFFRQYNTVGHLHFYTEATAKIVLNRLGFDLLACHYTDAYITLPRKRTPLARLVDGFRFVLSKIFSQKISHLCLGGNTLLIAAKYG